MKKAAPKPASTNAEMPQSALGRASRLLFAGAKIATREVKDRVAAKILALPETSRLATKIKQTQELVDTLSQLKGAAMKAGQLISLEFSDMLPPEVTEVLRSLHDSATSMPYAEVESILLRELGGAGRSRLVDLTREPIASASIGQVHKAYVDGKPVAVKVQFPGVAKSIDSDLAVVKRLAGLVLQAQGKDINLDDVFAELAEGLRRETDYLKEAACLNRYRATLYANPERRDHYVVPEVVAELCSARVLTLSFESGERINDWLRSSPQADEVERFARLIEDLILEEFFVMGLVQTDPNYGNFLYRPAAKNGGRAQLVLLDFGATNSYSKQFRAEIRKIIQLAAEAQWQAMIAETHRMGLLDPRESAEVHALFVEMMQVIMRMFDPKNQPFHFADTKFLTEIRDVSMRFAQKIKFSAPARQVIFLNRKLGGMFHLLKDAGAVLDLRYYYDRVMKLDIGGTP